MWVRERERHKNTEEEEEEGEKAISRIVKIKIDMRTKWKKLFTSRSKQFFFIHFTRLASDVAKHSTRFFYLWIFKTHRFNSLLRAGFGCFCFFYWGYFKQLQIFLFLYNDDSFPVRNYDYFLLSHSVKKIMNEKFWLFFLFAQQTVMK